MHWNPWTFQYRCSRGPNHVAESLSRGPAPCRYSIFKFEKKIQDPRVSWRQLNLSCIYGPYPTIITSELMQCIISFFLLSPIINLEYIYNFASVLLSLRTSFATNLCRSSVHGRFRLHWGLPDPIIHVGCGHAKYFHWVSMSLAVTPIPLNGTNLVTMRNPILIPQFNGIRFS